MASFSLVARFRSQTPTCEHTLNVNIPPCVTVTVKGGSNNEEQQGRPTIPSHIYSLRTHRTLHTDHLRQIPSLTLTWHLISQPHDLREVTKQILRGWWEENQEAVRRLRMQKRNKGVVEHDNPIC